MVRIARSTAGTTTVSKKNRRRLQWLYQSIVALACLTLLFQISSLQPHPPTVRPPPILLTWPNTTTITTDVRGNLGPAEVMLTDGTDWIKDRWQAASDMHGTAIKGHHVVELAWKTPVLVSHIILDWEAAFSKNYMLESSLDQVQWTPLCDTTTQQLQDYPLQWSATHHQGQSPGVKTKTPLHVLHEITPSNATTIPPPELQYLRLTIRSSAMGWGVSLWRIQVFGWPSVAVP